MDRAVLVLVAERDHRLVLRQVRAQLGQRGVAYLYIAPAFVFYLVFAFGPLAYTTWLSFFDWDGLTVGTWVGLDNYDEVLRDPDIRASFVHSFVLIVFYAVLPSSVHLNCWSVSSVKESFQPYAFAYSSSGRISPAFTSSPSTW